MRSLVRLARLGAAVVVAGAVLAAPATPAAASPAMLRLTVYDGTDETGANIGEVRLYCNPSGGSHPEAGAACAALRKVAGDFEKIEASEGICIKVYEPVTAVADGWYRGFVHFKHTYDNACTLRNALGPVFDF